MTGCEKQQSQADPGRDLLAELCKAPSPAAGQSMNRLPSLAQLVPAQQVEKATRDTPAGPGAPGLTITGSPRDKEMYNDCDMSALHCTLDPAQRSSFLMAAKMLLDLH